MRRLRRRAALALGIPAWQYDALLDERRYAISVSHHAIQQAGERYRRGNPVDILHDVVDALHCGRIGKEVPHGRGRKARGGVCAWTEAKDRVYVLRRVRKGWIVVTALPAVEAAPPKPKRPMIPAWGSGAFGRRAQPDVDCDHALARNP